MPQIVSQFWRSQDQEHHYWPTPWAAGPHKPGQIFILYQDLWPGTGSLKVARGFLIVCWLLRLAQHLPSIHHEERSTTHAHPWQPVYSSSNKLAYRSTAILALAEIMMATCSGRVELTKLRNSSSVITLGS